MKKKQITAQNYDLSEAKCQAQKTLERDEKALDILTLGNGCK